MTHQPQQSVTMYPMIAVKRAGEISMTGSVVFGKSSQLEEILGYHARMMAGVLDRGSGAGFFCFSRTTYPLGMNGAVLKIR